MAFNMHNRNLLSLMHHSTRELKFLLDLSRDLKRAKYSGTETQHLKGKNIALFGSYGWGDGEWMRNWEESCKEAGANLVCDSVICQEEPDDEATDACKALGAALV